MRAAQGRSRRRRSGLLCSCVIRSAVKPRAVKPKAKSKAAAKRGLHLPQALEQRHLDLIGLFLIAAGVYLSFVLFFGWEGGKVGYGVETGLVYLFGTVGARIATVLMLLVGGLLVTGTSISTLFRGIGRGLRRIFLGGRGVAQTAIQTRRDRQEEKTFSFETAGRADGRDERLPGGGRRRADRRARRGAGARRSRRPSPRASTPSWRRSRPRKTRPSSIRVPEPEQVALTPAGQQARRHDLRGIDYKPPPAKSLERGKGDKGVDPRDHEIVGRKLVETLGALQGRGEDRRHRQRPARLPLRTAPGARHQGEEGDRALQRPRLRAGLDRHPHPGADPRQAGGRGRGAEHAPPHRPPRRHLLRPAREDLAAGRLARQGDRRQPGLDRPGEDAARARRRHHRLGQVRLRQRDPLLDPDAGLAQRRAPRPGRPQAGRAQPLRERAPPADAGRHLAAPRRQRARQPDRRDGEPLRDHGPGPLPQPRRAQPRPRQGRRSRRCRTSSA